MINWLPLFIVCFIISTTLSVFCYKEYSKIEEKILNQQSIQSDIYNKNTEKILDEIFNSRSQLGLSIENHFDGFRQFEDRLFYFKSSIPHIHTSHWKPNDITPIFSLTNLEMEKEKIYIKFVICILFAATSLICIFIHLYFSHLFSELERLTNYRKQ